MLRAIRKSQEVWKKPWLRAAISQNAAASLKRTKDLLSGPAFANRQTMDESGKKNLKLEVQENHVPHAQLATQNVISRHKDPALDVKV